MFIVDEVIKLVKENVDLKQQLKSQQEWVSVEDRLPELSERGYSKPCLIFDGEDFNVAEYSKEDDVWFDSGSQSYWTYATHWKAPTPPKEDE